MLALALGGFGIGTTEFVSMGLLPEMATTMGVSEPSAGHLISAYAVGVVVGAPVIAALAARVPRRTLLLALMVAFTLGNLGTVFAPSFHELMASRFVAGLPHGAYFGVAALVAAHLADPGARAKSVAMVMMGLSVANVVGVPAATWIGQAFGWRSAFGIVAVIGALTVTALAVWLPRLDSMPTTNPRTELGAFRRTQVWMTLFVGMVGFGGMFAVYTYIATTLTDVAGLSKAAVPLALMIYGLGMVVGNMAGGWIADRMLVPGLFLAMTSVAVSLAVFVAAAHNPVTALIVVFLIAASGSAIVPGLQTRLMDVAADAQTLAASLNHAAFNFANALGAALGGAVIAAGFGYTAPAVVGAGLAIAGIAVLATSVAMQRRTDARLAA
ncbi:MFS transporter [Rhodococcus sp. BP-316]|jgi:DHA1 family inner membrane transport protein|uniref:MFS transporter n=1 Tax=unclassified Rhodococcus (in: high G+C Gram-positive bacteria) TaxID=192944 RepID=UPI000485F5AB|nr:MULTISPECIES: MFS transporter [unclassified Rhodococcus (in: high G+C Gram-positive bacteria)]KQU31355.1 MFS transporter [Rhodococcus sp. Leaf225]KQU41612.1 MFS transporter [Rhodococcus sp. Leaf258]MBY6677987.1 MFS transporter [Rhodococcus sp. BP-332]MBY6681844.1 MFS transporter [Rhodococcus sp. BP-316]MBY6706486.1 MFS transporter [Rhodococcus sp. BP-241]